MKAPVVTVTARTGGEPDLRFLNDGTAVCSVRAVWSQDRPDGTGGWIKEHETWLTIEWWAKAAEHTADLAIDAGDLVRVTGPLFMESYTRRDGSPGQALKLRGDGTPKHWRKRDRDGDAPAGPGAGAGAGPAARPAPAPAPEPTLPGGGVSHVDPPF